MRVDAIEGLRAWLAWSVVVGHIAQICGVDRSTFGVTEFLATQAVQIFIVISGFVIAGTLIARDESWPHYITRRAFRIFPLYLLLLPVGLLTTFLARDAIPHMAWAADPRFTWDDSIQRMIASIEAHPASHALLHLTLLQGAVPDSVLPASSTTFIGPAWSLSLEWQFYLIAPLLVSMLSRRSWSFNAVLAVATLAVLARLGAFGFFALPSFFPILGYLFVIGIGSRLVFAKLRRADLHFGAIALACVAGAALYRDLFSIALWGAFFALLFCANRSSDERIGQKVRRVAFESPLALHLGARSYAVYLVHWPIVQLMAYLILPLGSFSQWQALGLIGAATIAATWASSEILHVAIERPMIRLGAAIANGHGGRARSLQTAGQP